MKIQSFVMWLVILVVFVQSNNEGRLLETTLWYLVGCLIGFGIIGLWNLIKARRDKL